MQNTRLHLVLASLLLFFFVATSSGFANISAIQEQLRGVQLKLIKEKLKLVQEEILNVSKKKEKEESPLSREELAKRVRTQIAALDDVVMALRPRAIKEETARLESRIGAINQELAGATVERVRELQNELKTILAEYAGIQQEVKKALQEELQQKQALLLKQQVRALEERVLLTPRPTPAPPAATTQLTKENPQVKALQEQIEKAQLRLLQEQSRVIQRKIDELKAAK